MFNERIRRPAKETVEHAIQEAKAIETELSNIDEPEPAEELPPDYKPERRLTMRRP